MTEFVVASLRNIRKIPAQCCLVEFEDVIADTLNATVISPIQSERQARRNKMVSRINPKCYISPPPSSPTPHRVLILVALTMSDAIKLILSMLNSIDEYEMVCAYVFDAGLRNARDNRFKWKKNLSLSYNAVRKIHHLFTPVTGSVGALSEYFDIPVHALPLAADAIKHGSGKICRPIDVTGYGRQNTTHGNLLSLAFNSPDSPRIFYHTDHITATSVTDFYSHRRFFWKILTNSKISLAYNHLDTNPDGRFKFSFLGQRWFESLAAGCLIVGRKPECPEADRLFFWRDATIELPSLPDKVVPFIEDLLLDTERLEVAHRNNYHFALTRNDWGHRIADMLDILNIPCQKGLKARLDMLIEMGHKDKAAWSAPQTALFTSVEDAAA